MHGIQGHNPSFAKLQRAEQLERTDLILLLTNIALPEHRAGHHIIATEQMNKMSLYAGGVKGLGSWV
jgi:hypothetical protein